MGNVVRDTAEQAPDARHPLAADDDQVGIDSLCLGNNHVGRLSPDRGDGDGEVSAKPGGDVSQGLLGACDGGEDVGVGAGGDLGRRVGGHRAHDVERRPESTSERCGFDGGRQRGFAGVDANNDDVDGRKVLGSDHVPNIEPERSACPDWAIRRL